MSDADFKAELLRLIGRAREALLWKLEGLSEYDVRRPMTPTGTNLLGVVKHVASVELGYFGDTFGRRAPEELPWFEDGAEPNADMWATADESRDDIIALYRRSAAHADSVVEDLPLDAVGRVPWWPPERAEVTLQFVLVYMIAETERHAGHADIVRELIDGSAGVRPGASNLASDDTQWWAQYRARVQEAAEIAGGRAAAERG